MARIRRAVISSSPEGPGASNHPKWSFPLWIKAGDITKLSRICFKGSSFPRWVMLAMAIGYALLFMHLSGGGIDRLYSRSPYHRMQAEALLNGHFYLADSIYQITLDLAWHNGQIQQIWGLGVGLWLLPFEAVRRCLGGLAIPDRLALGVAVFLFATYAGFTVLRLARDLKSRIFGICLGGVLLFFPPFWILALAPQLIYEETVLYACLTSQVILIALLRFAVYRQTSDFLICCFLSALTGLMRPTHIIYGFIGVTMAVALLYGRSPRLGSKAKKVHSRSFREHRLAALGVVIFLSELLFLAWSNQVRFGSISEFGHRLTATAPMIVFFSRFSQPYPHSDWPGLAKELFSWLFLPVQEIGKAQSLDNLVYLQAGVPRWRDVYLPTFNLGYLALLLVGITGALRLGIRQLRHRGFRLFSRFKIPSGVFVLAIWTLISFTVLFVFYLPFNTLSSRYIMDFIPAIQGGVLLGVATLFWRFPKITMMVLLMVLGTDLVRVCQNPILNQPTKTPYIRGLAPSLGSTLDEFDGGYSPDMHPAETELRFNGMGWSKNGLAGPIVIAAVDAPRFLELTVEPRLASKGEPDIYRARIGSFELPVTSVTNVNKTIVVRFEVPEAIRQRSGEELVFLCFVKTLLPSDLDSHRMLRSVKWR